MTATGFDFEPLPSGDVLIQFFADDGKKIKTPLITREGLVRLPVVVHAFFLAVEQGQEVALDFLKNMAAVKANHEWRTMKEGICKLEPCISRLKTPT